MSATRAGIVTSGQSEAGLCNVGQWYYLAKMRHEEVKPRQHNITRSALLWPVLWTVNLPQHVHDEGEVLDAVNQLVDGVGLLPLK